MSLLFLLLLLLLFVCIDDGEKRRKKEQKKGEREGERYVSGRLMVLENRDARMRGEECVGEGLLLFSLVQSCVFACLSFV